MTAAQILGWLDLEQGTASKSGIRRLWAATPDEGSGDPTPGFLRLGCKRVEHDNYPTSRDLHIMSGRPYPA